MVWVKKFSIVLTLLLLSNLSAFSEYAWETPDGYYVDKRGNVQNSYIKPPHPEFIPYSSQLVQPIVDFKTYYYVNSSGYRASEDKLPLIPEYTHHYSTRKPQIYNREDYIKVWCDGKRHVGKVDCLTQDYAISFFPLSAWTRAITTASWRARKFSQTGMAALYIEDMASKSSDMYEAKKWAEKWGVKVMFISIDAGIPEEWI